MANNLSEGETVEAPNLNASVRKVVELVASWCGLYAHHTNVEEGNYLRCLICDGESLYHRRDLTPADVGHVKGCVVALANEILPALGADSAVAEVDRLEQIVCDFQAAALLGTDPASVTPAIAERQVTELRTEVEAVWDAAIDTAVDACGEMEKHANNLKWDDAVRRGWKIQQVGGTRVAHALHLAKAKANSSYSTGEKGNGKREG